MSNEYTQLADRLLKKDGYIIARYKNAMMRDESSWGTFTHGWHVQVGKEIDRLYRERPEEYKP